MANPLSRREVLKYGAFTTVGGVLTPGVVLAQAITTDNKGIIARDIQLSSSCATIPAYDARPEAVVGDLTASGAALVSVTPLHTTLEEIFVEHVAKTASARTIDSSASERCGTTTTALELVATCRIRPVSGLRPPAATPS